MNYEIGFIGAGTMAQAIGLRLIKKGLVKFNEMIVSAPSETNFNIWSTNGVNITTKNIEVVQKSKIIFMAVKPQYFESAVRSLCITDDACCDNLSNYKLFVSIMGGKTIQSITETITLLAPNINNFGVIRVMPNTPCLVGSGCSVMCHNPNIAEKYVIKVLELMKSTGSCEIIPEHMFNSTAAICGSGPAYISLVVESLADGGVLCGVPRELSMRLAMETMIGTCKMMMDTKKHPGQLKDEVCSAGGTSIVGIQQLESSGLRHAFMNAIQAATKRGDELAQIKK